MEERVCVQERPALGIPIALSGIAVAPTTEIEEWSGPNGSRPCKWFPSDQEKRACRNFVSLATSV